MGDVTGEDLRAQPYAMRLKKLRERGVGLWDVIESADRQGSLDSAIRSAELRDLSLFIQRLPCLRAVAFNGRTAALHGRQRIGPDSGLTLIDLPSSSGAYASMSRDRKKDAWLVLREWMTSP